MQGCEYGFEISSSLECSNQRLRLKLRIEAGHWVVLAIKKTPLLKMSSGRETSLKFSKRRSVSFGWRYTKRYLRKFVKLSERSRKQVELGRGKETSSTDESVNNTDVEEAQPDLTTNALCVITTEEFGFRSTLDSEAGGSLEQSGYVNGISSDKLEDGYVDPQLNTGVEGTEEMQRINEGEIRQNNVWVIKRDSNDLWFRMGVAYNCVYQGNGPRKESYPVSLGSSTDLGSRSEEVRAMPIVWYPQVDSTSDVVYSRRREPQSVVDLHYEMMGLRAMSTAEGSSFVREDSVSTCVEICCHQGQCGFRQVGRRDGADLSWRGDVSGGWDLQMRDGGPLRRWEDISSSIEERNVFEEVKSLF